MHSDKDPIRLFKAIKDLKFRFDSNKEYKMSLLEDIDKLFQLYQSKDMTNAQFLDS
jgi:hypothetical protein